MELKCLDVAHFSDVYNTPKLGISTRGDSCFCTTHDGEPALDKQRRFFLNICRTDGSSLRTQLPNPPALVEGSLYDGISHLAPQIINDYIYLGLAPEWIYGLRGSNCRVKLDWTGRILWLKEFSEEPNVYAYPIITRTGRQYILFDSDKTKTLMCLSDQRAVQWTLQEKWMSKIAPWMFSLPDECVLLVEVTTKPAPGGHLSKLYIVDSDGKVITKQNNLIQEAAQNNIYDLSAYLFHQSPVCPPQHSLVYLPHCLPYWGYETPQDHGCPPKKTSFYSAPSFPYVDPEIPLKLIYEPQIIALYYPLTDQFEKKEFLVGDVHRFLWDEEKQVLYTCADKKRDDISRIDFQKGLIQYHTYHGNHDTFEPHPPVPPAPPDEQPKIKPWSRRNIEPPPDYICHCLPVMTEWGDVIFCHSGTMVVCMSSDWKEKWKIELPRGACDMKLAGNLLFIMIYNEVEHRAELRKFLVG